MKYLLIGFILIASADISAGIGYSSLDIWGGSEPKPKQRTGTITVDQVTQEFKAYLNNISLKSVSTRSMLEQQVQEAVNKDIRDAAKLPLFHGYMKQGHQSESSYSMNAIINVMTKNFIEQKSTELSNK